MTNHLTGTHTAADNKRLDFRHRTPRPRQLGLDNGTDTGGKRAIQSMHALDDHIQPRQKVHKRCGVGQP